MPDSPNRTFQWRDPNTPLADLSPGQIAHCDPPPGETGSWVVLRGFDGMGKGPLRWAGATEDGSQVHLSSGRF